MKEEPKILVVGSFVMDQIMTTTVFPKTGQTVLGKGFEKAPGGKGANQAVQMARLGANVTLVGKVGNDGNGQELLAACSESGIDVCHVAVDHERRSSCSVIILEERPDGTVENRIIVNPGANMSIRSNDVAFLQETIAGYDMVVLQLEIPMEINELVAGYARDKNVPVMLNPAPAAPLSEKLLSCLTYISPNETEAEALTGIHIPHEGRNINMEKVRRAAETLGRRGIHHVLITLGSAGAALFTKEDMFYAPGVADIIPVDPTAAGDSFVGAFCCAVCRGLSFPSALRYANYTAALTVSQLGAMPSLPTRTAVDDLIRR